MHERQVLDSRVTELEARYTLQQDLLQQLSDVVFGQQKQLSALALRVSMLEKRLAATDTEGDDRNPDDEVPPHY